MQFCNQDISKTITGRSFKLGQWIEDNEYYLVKIKNKKFVIALCNFGQRKLDISKTIAARSFKLGQLIEDNE